jgi:hypothetical protein
MTVMLSHKLTNEGKLLKFLIMLENEALGQLGGNNTESALSKEMLKRTLVHRDLARLGAARIAAYVGRHGLHKELGYPTLYAMFKDCGYETSWAGRLGRLGGLIINYADEHGVSIDNVVCSKHFAKLREAIDALRAAADADDLERFMAILADVRTFSSRDDIRLKWRKRTKPMCKGYVIRLGDTNKFALAALVPSQDAMDVITFKTRLVMETEHDIAGHQNEVASLLELALETVKESTMTSFVDREDAYNNAWDEQHRKRTGPQSGDTQDKQHGYTIEVVSDLCKRWRAIVRFSDGGSYSTALKDVKKEALEDAERWLEAWAKGKAT